MMSLTLYRGASVVLSPAIEIFLKKRIARGKEDAHRLAERRGIASLPRPSGRLVWIHAASVGESLSSLPLIDGLLGEWPDISVLVTTGTVTSAELMTRRLPERAFHQYVPIDRPGDVRRFLSYWRPDLALWMESELWPNLVTETAARGVPMVLVNGRMSERSFERWRRWRGTIGHLLGLFRLVMGQSAEAAERLAALGARDVVMLGNLKAAADPLPDLPEERAALERAVGRRPLWLAASTHRGEEIAVGEAHARLAETDRDVLTILAPRHPERGAEVAAALKERGLKVAQRSAGELPGPDTEIYLADTLGELGLFYRLSRIAFIGGSLIPHGGQNPMEAARLGSIVLHGPNMQNFPEACAALASAGASIEVAGSDGLAREVASLWQDPERLESMGRAATKAGVAEAGVVEAVVERLRPLLGRGG
jgi:3-deoxy-D-manno-octulosonic-acid transferase